MNKQVKQVPPAKKTETHPNDGILDRVIANITEDQTALNEQNELIEKAKSYKREIQDRLRDSKRDLVTFVKYANSEQLKRLEELEIDVESLGHSLNKVAEVAFDIISKTEKGEMTNGVLHEAYVKTFKNPDDAFNYTEFNIRCRTLYNSQRLIRIEPKNAKSTRDHVIRINGFQVKN